MPSEVFRVNPAKLTEARIRAGLTGPALAAAIGAGPNYVWRIEAGEYQPRPHRLIAIAAALGVDLDAITERTAA